MESNPTAVAHSQVAHPIHKSGSCRSEPAEAVARQSGQNVNLRCQCRKGAAGCPLSYAMDYKPARLIHANRLRTDDLVPAGERWAFELVGTLHSLGVLE